MHKNTMKCNETLSKWCKNKHGASKIIDTFETYHTAPNVGAKSGGRERGGTNKPRGPGGLYIGGGARYHLPGVSLP
jgi:hypothetical protein